MEVEKKTLRDTGRDLLRWYRRVRKPLPWRDDPAPYRMWVGEVMSQQTTLAVVVPRFKQFIRELPDVQALAACSEVRLRSLWSGLGYYARARNLKKGAQLVMDEMGGRLPDSYEGWRQIPGCGPYTAAMVASMSLGIRVPAVDGNVMRVVSRLLAMEQGVWESRGRSLIEDFARRLMGSTTSPGDLNQAVMELGQEVCRKTGPHCDRCPVAKYCLALSRATVSRCPPPKPKRAPEALALTVIIVRIASTGQVLVGGRKEGFLSSTVGFPLFLPQMEKKAIEAVSSLTRVRANRPRPTLQAHHHPPQNHGRSSCPKHLRNGSCREWAGRRPGPPVR